VAGSSPPSSLLALGVALLLGGGGVSGLLVVVAAGAALDVGVDPGLDGALLAATLEQVELLQLPLALLERRLLINVRKAQLITLSSHDTTNDTTHKVSMRNGGETCAHCGVCVCVCVKIPS
jgi:hypothetical protein